VAKALETGSCTRVFRITAPVTAITTMATQAVKKLFIGADCTPFSDPNEALAAETGGRG
jgi:hypothetical protein